MLKEKKDFGNEAKKSGHVSTLENGKSDKRNESHPRSEKTAAAKEGTIFGKSGLEEHLDVLEL